MRITVRRDGERPLARILVLGDAVMVVALSVRLKRSAVGRTAGSVTLLRIV
jgi:hypothetical protein